MARISRSHIRRGFRLVELLVVLLMAAVALAMLFPALGIVIDQRDRSISNSHLKQTTYAALLHIESNKGNLPGWHTDHMTDQGSCRGSVFYVILPWRDYSDIYQKGRTARDTYVASSAVSVPIRHYLSPCDPTADLQRDWTSYVCNGLAFTRVDADHLARKFPDGISDGPSRTIAFMEGHANTSAGPRVWWDALGGAPLAIMQADSQFEQTPMAGKADERLPQSFYSAGILVSLFDGSVRNIRPNVSRATWAAAMTPSGQDELGQDW